IHERIDVLDVESFPHSGGSNIWLVQMIGGDDFDRFAQYLSAEIFYRHLGSSHRAHASDIRVDARHVLQHANFHDAVGNLFLGERSEWQCKQQGGGGRDKTRSLHRHLPNISLAAVAQKHRAADPAVLPQYRLGHLAQAQLLHFGAVWALDNRERFYYHNPLRDLEPRQLFQATCAQAPLVHLRPAPPRPGPSLNETYRYRVGQPSGSRHNLYSSHARLRLNDSLDLLGADQEATETYGVANPRFIDEVAASQAGKITRSEHAISVD